MHSRPGLSITYRRKQGEAVSRCTSCLHDEGGQADDGRHSELADSRAQTERSEEAGTICGEEKIEVTITAALGWISLRRRFFRCRFCAGEEFFSVFAVSVSGWSLAREQC